MKSMVLVIFLFMNTTPAPRPDPPTGDPPKVAAVSPKALATPIQIQEVKRWTVKWLEKPTYTFLWLAWGGRMIALRGGACPDYLNCTEGKTSLLDSDGQVLIASSDDQYLEIRKDGYILVRGGLHGFVDAEGKLLIEPKYDRITRQGDAFFEVQSKADGKQLVTREGKLVLSGFEELEFGQENRIWVLRGGRWSLHDLTGKPLGANKSWELDVVGERTAAVRVGNRWALVDASGRRLTLLRYHSIGVAVNGLLPFNIGGNCEEGFEYCEGGRYGVLREDGKELLSAEHDCVDIMGVGEDDAEIRVMKSPEGLEPHATQADRCSGGRVRVLKKDGTPWFKDTFAYLDAQDDATHLRAVKDGACDLQGNCARGKWGVIDLSGKVVLDFRYDVIDTLREGGTLFVKDGKWGLLDGTFQEVIPAKYEMLHLGKEELRFLENGKWGILDPSGKVVVPAKYEMILPFVKGVARFQDKGKWGLISSVGKILAPADQVAICRPNFDTFVFANVGACKVATGPGYYEPTIVAEGRQLRRMGWSNPDCECQETSLGLMDAAGKVLIPPKYRAIKVQTSVNYSDRREGRVVHMGGFAGLPAGQAWVRLNLGGKCTRLGTCVGGKWGVADLKGRVIVPVTHDYIEPQADLLMRVAQGGACEVLNWQARKCAPETKWGLIRLEPGK